ncbi:NAD(P)-dependent alcohol dehydrogenase [Acinetobacter nectaris]|uniref:NAD(P)-dependent alcohol dehydrogenase n=1 Tax=Acinetobacter nectaris TaxID=1219382 RepID=UPI001F1817D5|nr:NAD(P)-dependent alcohol dehydrogenase [Acinetobacter nectaris]MCF8999621.1 NAD(P)-dependent alcohol dehydrogenase [Acinetobacter nectaris]MCF9028175.1 NAD(P)-dependent alcohol dehydrogenase [Acinetobacter nectaris]
MNIKNVKAYGTYAANEPLKQMAINRRSIGKTDVELEVLYCGICHSDLHQIHNDFGHTMWPVVPGHEIVGRVKAVGEHVSKFKVGQLAAIGCIVDSCKTCQFCEHDTEQFCEEGTTFSFNSPDKYMGGEQTYGGFSDLYVCDERYVLQMPEFKDLAAAAPLLCAGITVYSPLKHWNIKEGSKVGILGVGGLGHIAIKIAKALGAEVTVFTTSDNKIADAKRLGADYAVLSTDTVQLQEYNKKFDFILDTISAKHDVNQYLNLLTWEGSLVLVGLPPESLEVGAFNVVYGRRSFSGSNIGGIAETQEMLDFCFKHDITADIELIDVEQINNAFSRLEKGDIKYRFVVDLQNNI